MTTAKWILCVIAASAISSYATFHLNQSNQNESGIAPSIENFSTLHTSIKHQKDEHQELAKNNDAASDSCNKSINKTVNSQPEKMAINQNKAQRVSADNLQLAYEKKQNEMNSFREFIQKNGDSVLSVISKSYESEPIDPTWARSKEDELLALLETNDTLQNTAPLELSCKSKNCRLVLSVQDGNQGESLYNAFRSDALKGSDENKNQVISYFSNPNNREIHIYLSQSTVSTLLDGKMD
jgi:hypothetical protein